MGAVAGDYLIQVVGYNGKESLKFIPEVEALGPSIRCSALPHADITDVMTRKGAIIVPDEPVTLCLVKPHILRDQAIGEVITKILDEGYVFRGLCLDVYCSILLVSYVIWSGASAALIFFYHILQKQHTT